MFKTRTATDAAKLGALALILQGCDVNGTTPKATIQDDSVIESKMADNSISSRAIIASAVTTSKLADQSVTAAKLDPTIALGGSTGVFTGAVSVGTTLTVGTTMSVGTTMTVGSTLGVTGNFSVNTSKFTVAAATGNTTVLGTLTVGAAIGTTNTTTINGATIHQTTFAGLQPLTVTRGDSTAYGTTAGQSSFSSVFTANLAAGSTETYFGASGEAIVNTPFTAGGLTGVFGRATLNSAGGAPTATTAIGVDSQLLFGAAGTMSNAYGLHTKLTYGPGNVGTIGNRYIGLFIENPTAGGAASALNAAGALYGIVADGAATLNFFAGKVGIGNSNPTNALDVTGAIAGTTTITAGTGMVATTGNITTTVGNIIAAGCVKADGGATALGGVCASDRRLKTDIADFQSGLSDLMRLRPRSYKFNGLAENPTDREAVGFIAQEVEQVIPSLVSTQQVKMHPGDRELSEIKVVNYSRFLYIAINAIKELYGKWSADHSELEKQKVQLAQVEKKIEIENLALKAENKSLKARLDKIELALAQAAPSNAITHKGRKLATK